MNTSYGANPHYFGHADYYGNLGAGMSNQAILNWVNSNTGRLRPDRFKPGELVSEISSAAQRERQQAAEVARRQQEAAARQAEIQRQEELRQAEIARQEQLQRELQEAEAERQRQAEAAQAERLKQMEIGQRTQAANTSRAGMQSKFQINSGTQSQKTSGTQGFKRRQLQVNPSAYSSLASGAPKKSTLPGVINV